MKTLFKTAIYLSAILMAGSCVLDKIDSQPATEPRLECDALESYTIQASKPQDISFRVSATTPWTVTGFEGASWISVSPASSAVSSLSEDIRIKAEANTEFKDRSVVLTVQGENTDILYKVTVTQLRKGMLVVTPVSGEFDKAGQSRPFTIEANLAWEVYAADSWLTFSENSGNGDGSPKTIQAIAGKNTSIVRQTRVSVVSGDMLSEFDVVQNGEFLEFLSVENTQIDRTGGEIVLGVKASLDWVVETDNPDFTVTKGGNDKVTVSAPWNNKFAPRTVNVTIKPAGAEFGDVSNSIQLTQDVNFKLDGNCEVLEDGSVKISCGQKSRVSTLDNFRFVSIVLTMGEVSFGEKGELWCATNVEGCNIYNQLSLGGNTRIRQDGTLPVAGTSTYKNEKFSITQDDLNAMTEYRFDVLPDEANPAYQIDRFYYNGKLLAELNYYSVFKDKADAAGSYWFGFYSETSDGTWYVVKSCDVIPVEE